MVFIFHTFSDPMVVLVGTLASKKVANHWNLMQGVRRPSSSTAFVHHYDALEDQGHKYERLLAFHFSISLGMGCHKPPGHWN